MIWQNVSLQGRQVKIKTESEISSPYHSASVISGLFYPDIFTAVVCTWIGNSQP